MLKLKNDIEPGGAKLPESDKADMEIFLENMIFTLGALGLGYFAIKETPKKIISSLTTEKEEYEGTIPIKKEGDSSFTLTLGTNNAEAEPYLQQIRGSLITSLATTLWTFFGITGRIE